jgi:hypothetical protein
MAVAFYCFAALHRARPLTILPQRYIQKGNQIATHQDALLPLFERAAAAVPFKLCWHHVNAARAHALHTHAAQAGGALPAMQWM